MQPLDFLAIGDIVTDVFIRIKDAEAYCDIDTKACKLALRFGDKVPFESAEEVRAVGNSANAAVAASRLGLSSALIANVGRDYHGDACLEELKKNNVRTDYIGRHEGFPTNYHYVLWYGVERTILVKHAKFPTALPVNLAAPKMIYLSSLGEGTEQYHAEIAAYVAAHPQVKLVFQPGTFQMKMGTLALKDIYAHTYAFFCNIEEAQRILATTEQDKKVLMQRLHALGPKLVFVTDGINGAYASDGTNAWFMPVYPHEPFERTGAGDAFASTVSCALLMGKTVPEALMWGPINSMSVVQYVGAQKGLLTKEKLAEYGKNSPADYIPKPI
jgi:ribokinase